VVIADTLDDYEVPIETVERVFGKRLAKYGIPSRMFWQLWITECERDTAYMVFTGRPETTTTSKWLVIMPRLLWQIGVPADEIKDFLVEEDVQAVAHAYDWELRPRKGFQEMLQILKEGGIKFKALSSADPRKIKHYFKTYGDIVPEEDVVDSTNKGGKKPQIQPYEWTWNKWKAEQPDEELVFAGECLLLTTMALAADFTATFQSGRDRGMPSSRFLYS
jgi:phosphoglycolate phosphatase-like HAD superfamily hydrolase